MLGVLATLLAGCGGEGDETSTLSAAESAARAKFAVKANRLCEKSRPADERKALDVFRSKASYYERTGSLEEFRGSLRRQEVAIVLAPSLRRRVGEVRALLVSKDPQVEKALDEIDAAAKAAMESPAAFLESGGMGEARDLARRYGIEACAVLYEQGGLYDKGSAMPGTRFTPRSSK
jgi:hypothetical protein